MSPAQDSRLLASLKHAWGGPTWVVVRPDQRVVIRMAFSEAERTVDASGLDEVLGLLLGDGRIRITASKHLRSLAWRSGAFAYDGARQRWNGRDCPLWSPRDPTDQPGPEGPTTGV